MNNDKILDLIDKAKVNKNEMNEQMEEDNTYLSNTEHPTLTGLAEDHVLSGEACKDCLKLIARHELNDNAFPVDPKVLTAYVDMSEKLLHSANQVMIETQQMIEEMEQTEQRIEQMLKDPIEYVEQQLVNTFKRYVRYGAALGTPIVMVISGIAYWLLTLIS